MTAVRRAYLGSLLAALGALSLLGCGSAVVGAECAPAHTRCGDRCFDLQSDPDHCGACDRSCGPFECSGAQCGPSLRPGVDGGGADGGVFAVDDPPFLIDGGFAFPDVTVGRGCSLGQSSCGQACADLRNNPSHCGACGAACAPGEFCLAGGCRMCDAPLRLCGSCVDVQTHPSNCGGCNTTCRSGICEDGACSDLLAGHVVLIGHDYTGARPSGTAMRLIGNAVFLASGSPVRTVVYEGTAARDAMDGVTEAFDYVVDRDGREWAPRSVADDDLVAELFDADALLVLAQARSSDAELVQLGQTVGLALSQFLLRGGVIVVLEGASAENVGTFQLLQPAGLFDAGAREAIASQTLEVTTPGVGVAARTTRTYLSPSASVRFVGVASPGTQVVRDRDGESVVFHRIVLP